MSDTKTIFFDFGGCLDAPGIHTRTLFFEAFLAEGLVTAAQREEFQEAYTRADRQMMDTGEAKALALAPFNRHNAALIGTELGLGTASAAADRVSALMHTYLAESRRALLPLRGRFELGVISNFTGNLEVILREFDLHDFFSTITESFYAGVSKPDPRIFRQALGPRAPHETLYIGDNPKNDIEPARALGMRAVLIHPPGQRRECAADLYVETLSAFVSWIQSK